MDTRTILLDVGGTYIKRPDGAPVPIPSGGTREEIALALRRAVEIPGTSPRMTRVGVAIPGPFDYKEGIFLMKHKFGAVYGERFAELAGIPEGVQVKYIHDVNAVLEGSIRMMGLEGKNTALVSLGTGLGFSVAVNGQVRYGPTGSPADVIWNLPWNGGILEDYASARAVRNGWMELGGDSSDSAATVARKAYDGDEKAYRVFSRMGETLGQALKDIIEEFNVETLLFAGQVSNSLILMEDGLRESLHELKITKAPAGAVFEGIKQLFEQ